MNEFPTLHYIDVWMVGFASSTSLWCRRLLRPGFSHVFAFAFDAEAERWVMFDPGYEGFLVRVAPDWLIDAWIGQAQRREIVVLRMHREGNELRRPRLIATCVTAIVHLLGLRRCCALTPYRLYKTLLARGATPAFTRADGRSTEGATTRS